MKQFLRLTIETGAITGASLRPTISFQVRCLPLPAGASVLCFILIAATNGQLYFVAILQSLPKLYSNTLLAQLNSRPKPYELDLGLLEHFHISFGKNDGDLCPESGSLELQLVASKDDEPLPRAEVDS